MADPLTENPLISSIFWGDATQGLTLEQLKARRAIAAALATKSRDYPNTIGKGIFSAAEDFAGMIRDRRDAAAEEAMRKSDAEKLVKNKDLLEASPPSVTTPPSGPAGPAAAPPPRADLRTGPAYAAADDTDLTKNQMVEALMRGQSESRPAPAQQPLRMAALSALPTMSDAGAPGATYGGPSPAGPGASMAEPPDQSPPTPSASPTAAAPGQVGTPPPAPAAGGGVAPAVDAGRNMATDAVMANSDFQPAGPQMGPPPQPPVQLAQVGGFGGGPSGGAAPSPAPPAGGIPGQPSIAPAPPGSPGIPVPPGGVRPDTSRFMPMTDAEATRRFGPPEKLPGPWVSNELRDKYNRAIGMSLDPYASDQLKARFKDAAARIAAENEKLHTEQTGLAKEKITRRDRLIDEENKRLYDEFQSQRDPVKIAEKNQAIMDNQLALRGGAPAPEVRKEMGEAQAAANATARRMQDFNIALQAMRDGVFVGAGANTRLDMAKLAAWATNNKQLSERAGSTELLKAKVLSTVGELVKDLKPVSGFEVAMGKAQAGDITMEPKALEAMIRQQLQRGYNDLARYDSRAHSVINNLTPDPEMNRRMEDKYKSPEADWYDRADLQHFLASANGPDAERNARKFDQRYGPGAAAFVLNRKMLNPGAR